MIKVLKCISGISGGSLDDVIGDGKPRIYIANHTGPRGAAAVLSALNKANPCLLVSQKRCGEELRLRKITKKRVITAAGGVNTKWLHEALRRLKCGESLLIFPGEIPAKGEGVSQNDNFDPAFVLLSLLSGAEIVPLYSSPKHTMFHCLNIKAGKPILPDSTAALTTEVLKKEGERVRNALSALAET